MGEVRDHISSQPYPSDEALVALVVQKNVEAFSTLYDRYSHGVYALAAHMLGEGDAEDVVQEVFFSLWNKAHQYDLQRGRFSGWLIAIARNQVIDHLKRRSQQSRFAAADKVDMLLANARDDAEGVEDQVWIRDSADAMLRALRAIPNEQRRVLVLAYFGGLSHSEIAGHLGIPLGTVKKRISLGLSKLRARMKRDDASVRQAHDEQVRQAHDANGEKTCQVDTIENEETRIKDGL